MPLGDILKKFDQLPEQKPMDGILTLPSNSQPKDGIPSDNDFKNEEMEGQISPVILHRF